ncbi:MAG: protein NrnU [Paucibacter sp.]|nr:protein NrnU [Roseateles sp.]
MAILVTGLLLFLGIHSVRILADDWRTARLAAWGEAKWKLGYTAVSLIGFALICWGFGQARQTPVALWPALPGMRHLTAALMLPALLLVVGGQFPRSWLRVKLRHPMLLGTKTWAFAHLLSNNTAADLLLFGGFLLWSVLCFRAARRRDRAAPPAAAEVSVAQTVASLVVGLLVYGAFAGGLHLLLIGVSPV